MWGGQPKDIIVATDLAAFFKNILPRKERKNKILFHVGINKVTCPKKIVRARLNYFGP